MFSIIVPAHNEAQLIQACLEGMLEGASPRDCEVLVVANGCSDRTAEIAASFGEPVRVISTPIASKSEALRLGDAAAKGFPRIYVDADVRIDFDSLRRVVEALGTSEPRAAAPRMHVDVEGASWAVRAYYAIWTRLPYHAQGMIGSGVYAMNEAGRARFDVFPDIISDDGFARLHFAPHERDTIEAARFTIRAPRTLSGVVRIKTRSQKGAVQLHRLYPELLRNDPRRYGSPLGAILARPWLWASAAVYLYVIALTKLRAYYMNYVGELGEWERDDTSRDAAGPTSLPAPEERLVK